MQIESLLQIKQIHKVLQCNDKIIAANPQNIKAYIKESQSYIRDKQYEETEGLLNKAKEIINYYHYFPKSMSY